MNNNFFIPYLLNFIFRFDMKLALGFLSLLLLFIPYIYLFRYQKQEISVSQILDRPRIFCIILTTKDKLNTRAKIIHDTWSSKCDNHSFIAKIPSFNSTLRSNLRDRQEIKYKDLFNVLKPKNFIMDRYTALTTKVLTSFMDVYEHHPNYDWYLKADDDTFLFVDNLRSFVADKDSRYPTTFGYNFVNQVNAGYHSGGASYLLSGKAMNQLTTKLNENSSFCLNQGVEDIDIAKCLRDLNIYPQNSTDERNKERFHPLSITDHFTGNFPDWLGNYSQNAPQKVFLFSI